MPSTVRPPSAVAVVGLHGRFPQAGDLDRFWSNLTGGRDAIGGLPAERRAWMAGGDGSSASPDLPADLPWRGGFTPGVDRFDHGFFGLMPREAQSMDPQQRLFLQTAWSALEDAGYAPSSLAGRRVGVFAGVGNADYPVLMRRDGVPVDVYRGTGIALTAVANRVSFLLDLHGPSQTIDTACSSSLVAIHRAVQAIEAGDCEMAIAGGVNLLLGPELFLAFTQAGMLGPSGRCRSFDAAADGYVRGEGVGAVVLVPLETAQTRGDYIYGVIRGTAENHGGRAHSFTAPNVNAQAAVVAEAWRRAGRPPGGAALIETHGTGTPLGDPIEINALRKSLAEGAEGAPPAGVDRPPVLLGALKSHIGHLEAAAGIAGVIKTLLSLQHRLVPGNLHFQELNPHIRLEDTPFVIPAGNTRLEADSPAAGVSSFGFGGVNAHVVLSAAEGNGRAAEDSPRPYLLPLSARDGAALRGRAEQLRRLLARRRTLAASPAETAQSRLVAALGLPASHATPSARDTALATLGLTLPHLSAALDRLDCRLEEMRDLVTLGEYADRLAERSRAAADDAEDSAGPVMLPGVALPPQMVRALTLPGIAAVLMLGRDAMEERLALVASTLTELEEKLEGFLAGTGEGRSWWRDRAQRRKDAVPPPAPRGWPTAEELGAWAAHWVGTRQAGLSWDSLCPGAARPGKIPLPAYPFRLDRVWYDAPATHKPQPAAIPRPGADARPAADTLSGDPWNRCWGAGSAIPPSSLTALGLMADSLARRAPGPLSLSRLTFGRPVTLTGAVPVLRLGRTGGAAGTPLLQCLAPDTASPVLLQAEPLRGALPPPGALPEGDSLRCLDAASFYGLLARHGLAVAAPCHRVAEARAGAEGVILRWKNAGTDQPDESFWTELLAALLAGAELLAGGGGPLRLPASIDRLDFDSRLTGRIDRMALTAPSSTPMALDLLAVTGDGRTALSIRALTLRPLPARLAPAQFTPAHPARQETV